MLDEPMYILLAICAPTFMLVAILRHRGTQILHSNDGQETNDSTTRQSSNSTSVCFIFGWILMVVGLFIIVWNRTLPNLGLNISRGIPPVSPDCPKSSLLIGAYGSGSTGQYMRSIRNNYGIQELFNQGMLHRFGFNEIEAVRNFQAAIDMDNECAMCYWGLAFAHSPTINSHGTDQMNINGNNAIQLAFKHITARSTPAEIRLIHAFGNLFTPSTSDWKTLSQAHFNQRFSEAMKVMASDFPNDADVLAIYAESLMNKTPWLYVSRSKNSSTSTSSSSRFETVTTEILPELVPAVKALQQSLNISAMSHPLALHLWIHITEQSDTPADGLAAADALARLAGGSGASHLVHMPSHSYFRTGQYDKCMESNTRAGALDQFYETRCFVPYVPLHNRALLVHAAMSSGRLSTAVAHTYPVRDSQPGIAQYLFGLFPPPLELVYARFGKWEEILDLNRAEASSVDSSSTRPIFLSAVAQYAKTLAHVNFFQDQHTQSSMKMLSQLSDVVDRIPGDVLSVEHPFYPYHRELGYLMNATAQASFAMKQGNIALAIEKLLPAVQLQDSFSYMEPENFYLPLRQCLGGAYAALATNPQLIRSDFLMTTKKRKMAMTKTTAATMPSSVDSLMSAARCYEQDLIEHPNNVWSLKGMTVAQQLMLKLATKARQFNLTMSESILGNFLEHKDAEHEFEVMWQQADTTAAIHGPCCELGLC